MKSAFSLTITTLLAASTQSALTGIPIVRCADGTIVFTGGTTGPYNPSPFYPTVFDPCMLHGGPIYLMDEFEMTLDCDKQDCENQRGGLVLGFPELEKEHMTFGMSGSAHNILLEEILKEDPKSKEELGRIGMKLMDRYYGRNDRHGRNIISRVMRYSQLSVWEKIDAWEENSSFSNLRGEKIKQTGFSLLRKVVKKMEGAEDLSDVIEAIDEAKMELKKLPLTKNQESFAKFCASCLDVFPASYSYWKTNASRSVREQGKRRTAGDWPWETDAVTFCTVGLQLVPFGPHVSVIGGAIGGAIASAGAYYRW